MGGHLPGHGKDVFLRAHPLVVLLLAPFTGLLFAVFLPFIGFAMALQLLGRKLVGGLLQGFWNASAFGWRPSEAYLLGRKPEDPMKDEESGDPSGDTGPPADEEEDR